MKCAWVLLLVACGSKDAAPPPAQPIDAPSESDALPENVAPASPDDDDAGVDPAAEDLGAVPAWRTVVDRDQYLARRGQHGVAEGTVGPAVDDLRWLVDDTEGNGVLGIRVRFGANPPVAGTRVAVGGAWIVDDAKRWVWVADSVSALPALPAPTKPPLDPPAAVPGLTVAVANGPSGVHRALPDKADTGDIVEMTVVSAPLRSGDGWGVASERYGTLLAYVVLPGEHASYGGHDMRSADERWGLKKGQTYWLRVARVHRHGTDPPVIDAATAPVRFP
jgi:hypothetical protein